MPPGTYAIIMLSEGRVKVWPKAGDVGVGVSGTGVCVGGGIVADGAILVAVGAGIVGA